MPITIQDGLPATDVLQRENIFCISSSRAEHQDIRPMRILLLNLMPKKIETEIHLLRMLSNTPLQVHIDLMRIDDRPSKNTPIEHMETFYKNFAAIRDSKFDGMIITGAPLGQVDFADVHFMDAMKEILDWSTENVTSTMFLCWAAQAAIYHLYGVEKHVLPKKISGVYPHRLVNPLSPIIRGFDDIFDAPHSRYAEIRKGDIEQVSELEIIADSEIAGAYIFVHREGKHVFVTGHSEYEPLCLKDEYERDLRAGSRPDVPENYFPGDDPDADPIVTWKSHGNLLFSNWINHYVYQLTPFEEAEIGNIRTNSPMQGR
ncbi:MAG: homoserine O-succinyltransferase [Gammaproteobacteria bacterium]|nr:homoserine O-succinyltransferase [Gammaproteobacteria bacterium]|tara:strand:- start:1133 stop:2083 length:951 start_codon:yes stop_codon:yes gene_type:complete